MLFESMRRAKVECNAQSYATMLTLHTRSHRGEGEGGGGGERDGV